MSIALPGRIRICDGGGGWRVRSISHGEGEDRGEERGDGLCKLSICEVLIGDDSMFHGTRRIYGFEKINVSQVDGAHSVEGTPSRFNRPIISY